MAQLSYSTKVWCWPNLGAPFETLRKYGGCRLRPTTVATHVGCAPGVIAQDGGRVFNGGAIVRTRVVRAMRFAALCHITPFMLTRHVFGVFDWGVAVRAAGGVAVQRLYGFVVCIRGHAERHRV